ncbi:MAG: endonuclease MutS2 [Candidatus Edwardsbacteria bacterium]|nr:endonuclease MutS2 [Candidatus Edwardsbacteria bacterium]
MNAHSLKLLEFDLVRRALSARAATPYGKELAAALLPSTSAEVVAENQELTAEAKKLLESGVRLELGVEKEIRSALELLRDQGALLEPLTLLSLSRHLFVARRAKSAITIRKDDYYRLARLANGLTTYKELEERIDKSIEPDGKIADRASSELFRVRKEQDMTRGRIRDKLDAMIGEHASSLQESIVTMREGRYVVPVRSEAKAKLKGIVHDTSASGATVFVEPLATVELNNKLRELQSAEAHEIERILQAFSTEAQEHCEAILINIGLIAQFDLLFAQAQLALDWQSVRPVLCATRYLKLVQARHPALADPVPLDIEFGDGKSALVITGPNTGGKTVVLKTVGLLAAMHQSGLQIPAGDGSALPLFDDIYADIGDEQSIAQSLSTFSSHVKQIASIIAAVTKNSLVLLDEIGVGTEPAEGSALAIAVLSDLAERGPLTLSTTHYGALKAFVHEHPAMRNAAMEFDRASLSPTYRLHLGVPGSSYGIEIASRLGIPERIVSNARARIDSKSVELESLLAQMEQARRDLERKQREAADKLDRAERIKAEYEEKVKGLKDELKSLKAQAESEAAEIIHKARSAAELAVAHIKKEQASKQSIREARELLKNAEFRRQNSEETESSKVERGTFDPDYQFALGEKVFVPGINKEGAVEVLPDGGGKLKVQVGGVRLALKRADLRMLGPRAYERSNDKTLGVSTEGEESFPLELHLLGYRADEALEKLDQYLDQAVLLGMGQVRIVHGKGTGVLRKVVKESLAKDKRVKSYRLGNWDEGQDGVTIAELA